MDSLSDMRCTGSGLVVNILIQRRFDLLPLDLVEILSGHP